MGFEQVVRKTWRENLLFSVLVELTYRCNLDCFFCYNDLGLRGEPLTTAEYLRLFADLRDMQVLNLTLSGGEPLAHPDFFRLGREARDLGFVVRVKSNGHALRGELARRLREEIDPFVVEVSLHGATAATHDRQTRVPGSFERLLANLRGMLELGLRVKANCTLTAWNEHEVEPLLDLAEGLGIPLQVDPEVTPRDNGDREPLAVSASREGVLGLFAALSRRERQRQTAASGLTAAGAASPPGPTATLPPPAPVAPLAPIVARGADDGTMPAPDRKHCGAGSAGIAVDPYGNVYPCVQWRRPVGNLHERSIREIWATSAGLAEVREITTAAKEMVAGYGEAGPFLNFCPGNAATLTGDPLAVYPAALRRMELAREWQQQTSRRELLPILP